MGVTAAPIEAAERPERVRTVVSVGDRTDLACYTLLRVAAPTLLIVGSRDAEVIALTGALERAAPLARDWCLHDLVRGQ